MPHKLDEDTLSFLVEWFDPLPQLTKQFLLKYFSETNEVEMVETKTRRLFLKRSPCPRHFSRKDFTLGSKVILYGRDLTVRSYADKATETALTTETESVSFLVSPCAFSALGKVLDELVNATGGLVSRLKMARLEPSLAAKATRCLELEGQGSRDAIAALGKGPTVFGVIRGIDARNHATKACARLTSLLGRGETGKTAVVWCSSSEQNAENLASLFAPGGPVAREQGSLTATFDNCTCCVIKPHAVKAGNVGKIIDHILKKGYRVSAAETFRLNRAQAQEFFEVYQGVIPQYSDLVDEMTTGTCVALEVTGQDVVTSFRETAGPWDVDMAKTLRPSSIRATFGENSVRTGVHCTDLPEDGPSECRYFFELMQGA